MTIPPTEVAKASPQEVAAPEPVKLPWLSRVAFLLCGLSLAVGFFLPWVTVGSAIELTGLGLVFSGGELVQAISGSGRLLLFLVPILGVLLIAGAVLGHRFTPWVAALGAGGLLVFAAVNVILLFISSTGLGMWMVVFASLSALTVGVLSTLRRA
jgi:hypothetical protein